MADLAETTPRSEEDFDAASTMLMLFLPRFTAQSVGVGARWQPPQAKACKPFEV